MAQPGKLAITFDDGYRDNYTHAFPVLERLGLRATVYVSTAYVETGDCFPWVMRNTNGREPHDDDRPLTWDHLHEMLRSGVFTVGSHTLTHPLLSGLDRASAHREICESKRVLESQLGVPVPTFCYPAGDFNRETIQLVDQSGYAAAVVTPNRFILETPLTLHRVGIYRNTTPLLFKVKTHRLVARAQKTRFTWRLKNQVTNLYHRRSGRRSTASADRY